MTFLNAGSLSVPELVRSLPEDEVTMGLVRLGFGTGRFRRIKYSVSCRAAGRAADGDGASASSW
jgi:hypothetical protein